MSVTRFQPLRTLHSAHFISANSLARLLATFQEFHLFRIFHSFHSVLIVLLRSTISQFHSIHTFTHDTYLARFTLSNSCAHFSRCAYPTLFTPFPQLYSFQPSWPFILFHSFHSSLFEHYAIFDLSVLSGLPITFGSTATFTFSDHHFQLSQSLQLSYLFTHISHMSEEPPPHALSLELKFEQHTFHPSYLLCHFPLLHFSIVFLSFTPMYTKFNLFHYTFPN